MNDLDLEMVRLAGKGYCCSQILMILALRLQRMENPGLVRAAGGLCHGLSQGCETCGALTGGACLLGYYAAKGRDDEEPHERLPLMLAELVEWFRTTPCAGLPGVRCEDILGCSGSSACGTPDPQRCGGLVSATFAKVLELLQAEGLDPREVRDPAV